jgi:hypothetical protein
MASVFDFKKLRRFTKIYAVVQVFLTALLFYMAMHFQADLGERFLNSVIATLVIQLILFYPINRFAVREARREVDACETGLSFDALKKLRTSRTIGEGVKVGAFLFFFTFIFKMPPNKFILSTTFLTFILTFLCYFQCFNFAAKRLMAGKS